MLEMKDLTAGYTNHVAIDNISIKAEEHSITAVIGPNGAGKTSLMRSIMGQTRIFSGSVIFKGEDITALPTNMRVKKGLTLVPQGRHIFPYMSVLENLEIGGYLIRNKNIFKKQLARVFELFPILHERKEQRAGTMSGGQQQMLSLARALMLQPQVMLLDEPSVGLAPKTIDEVYHAVINLNKQGLTLLLVEQNIAKALSVAERAFVMHRGRIVMQAPAKELSEDPKLISSYLSGY